MSLSNMTKQELLDYIKQQDVTRSLGLTVKLTDKGGIYIKSNEFSEISTKGKPYTACINLGKTTAKALFNNTTMLDAIREAVNAID